MAWSNYLTGIVNGNYGLPATIPGGMDFQASAIVDAYLNRPEGLLYVADANGNPAYMASATPRMKWTVTSGAIATGAAVQVTVSPANWSAYQIGEVLVLDRLNAATLEACVVTNVAADGATLTLDKVAFAHSANCSAEAGLVIEEERAMPDKRSITRVSRTPIANIKSLYGKYGYGRRSDQVGGLYQEMNLLAAVQTFGGPPQWIAINTAQANWSQVTGEIWVPAGLLLAYYSDVKIRYVTGWLSAPDPVIRATASIVNAMINGAFGTGSNNIQTIQAGDTRIQKFGPSDLSQDIKQLLNPYRALLLY